MIKKSLAAFAIVMATGVVQAAPFQNGSFESPVFGSSFANITNPSNSPTGWVPGGTLVNSSLFWQTYSQFSVPALDGNQLIGFGGNGTTGATISQTFDTVPGSTYQVSFYVTAQQVGSGPQSYSAQVLDGINVLGGDARAIPAASNWVQRQFSFVAASASSTIRFVDVSDGAQAGGINWALDKVVVTGNGSTPVPIAPTLGLMVAALLILPAHRALKRRRS